MRISVWSSDVCSSDLPGADGKVFFLLGPFHTQPRCYERKEVVSQLPSLLSESSGHDAGTRTTHPDGPITQGCLWEPPGSAGTQEMERQGRVSRFESQSCGGLLPRFTRIQNRLARRLTDFKDRLSQPLLMAFRTRRAFDGYPRLFRSGEHTSELQSLMRI